MIRTRRAWREPLGRRTGRNLNLCVAVAGTADSRRDPANREILRLLKATGGAQAFGDDVSPLELRVE